MTDVFKMIHDPTPDTTFFFQNADSQPEVDPSSGCYFAFSEETYLSIPCITLYLQKCRKELFLCPFELVYLKLKS